jgi:midasin (ATPase involved in ribosome maturation)
LTLVPHAGKINCDRKFSKSSEPVEPPNAIDPEQSGSRKRRKVADEELSSADLQSILDQWDSLLIEIETFELQHVKAGGKLVFAFVEGPLVQALRCGEW